MKLVFAKWLALSVVATLLTTTCAFGQLEVRGEAGNVQASGTATIKKKSDTLRVYVAIEAKGKDYKEALKNLQTRKSDAQDKLKKLGAGEAQIKFTDPRVMTSETDPRRRQMEMMIRQRMSGQARTAKKPKVAKPMVVATGLTAEWPLGGATPEALLLAAVDLQAKIKDANLGGTKGAAEEKSEEEEEMDDEASGMANFNSDEEAARPGEPRFAYVGKITAKERAAALEEAFGKAKDNATLLATAAGAKLGSLKYMSGGVGGDSDYVDDPYGRQAYMQMMRSMQQVQTTSDSTSEAVGAQPGDVQLKVSVSASFDLAKPAATPDK
jgi:uncharacterized protein YggE